jgi:hypothetical protein
MLFVSSLELFRANYVSTHLRTSNGDDMAQVNLKRRRLIGVKRRQTAPCILGMSH